MAPLVLLVLLGSTRLAIANDPPIDQRAEARHFTINVLPLLKEKCLGCHGADVDDIKGDFDVRSRASVIKGGESGEPAIIVGNSDDSPFYQAV
ncbi:MAG: hypothetical protein IH969_08490, partial [Candidatus Krumholzibacteriota bacterium]|nr:hypothetical protein [Candidatus Krumholzibacteriota bacterium]